MPEWRRTLDATSELVLTIPPNWFEEFDALTLGKGATRLMSIVELLARWAGVVDDDDYDTASAAMRELTVDSAAANVSASTGLAAASNLDGVDRLVGEQNPQLFLATLLAYAAGAPADPEPLTALLVGLGVAGLAMRSRTFKRRLRAGSAG